jgi:hypothetical protein
LKTRVNALMAGRGSAPSTWLAAAAHLDVEFSSKMSSRPPAEQAVAEALEVPEAANRRPPITHSR